MLGGYGARFCTWGRGGKRRCGRAYGIPGVMGSRRRQKAQRRRRVDSRRRGGARRRHGLLGPSGEVNGRSAAPWTWQEKKSTTCSSSSGVASSNYQTWQQVQSQTWQREMTNPRYFFSFHKEFWKSVHVDMTELTKPENRLLEKGPNASNDGPLTGRLTCWAARRKSPNGLPVMTRKADRSARWISTAEQTSETRLLINLSID